MALLVPEAPRWLQREQAGYRRLVQWRDHIFRPISQLFVSLHISASAISYAGLVAMAICAYFILTKPFVALLFLLLSLAADAFDGVVGRFAGHASDRGKFIDIVCDNLAHTIFVAGLVVHEVIHGIGGIGLIYLLAFTTIVRVISQTRYFQTDWLFRPVAGLFPVVIRVASYILFFSDIFLTGGQLGNTIAILLCLILLVDSILQFRTVLRLNK